MTIHNSPRLRGFVLGAILAAAVGSIHAQVYTEAGDAGASLLGANTLWNGTFQSIHGSLSSDTDADLFRVFIDNPMIFSASTVGGSSVDTLLFLLKDDGSPAFLNDDDPSGLSLQSTLASANFSSPLSSGFYYLGISTSGFEPQNENHQLLFAPFILDPAETRGEAFGLLPPTLDRFVSLFPSGDSGSYTISISGVGAPVPEASSIAWTVSALLVLGLTISRRRRLQ